MSSFTEKDFLMFAKEISEKISSYTKAYYNEKLLYGISCVEYKGCNELDTKGEHKIDAVVKELIIDEISKNHPNVLRYANIFMEEYEGYLKGDAICSIFIDPVDGSRSMDQHIGDPCVLFGFSPISGISNIKFNDLKSCFIKGLHSGDIYFTLSKKAYYVPSGNKFDFCDKSDSVVVTIGHEESKHILRPIEILGELPVDIRDACVIIRDGYGMRSTVEGKIDHSILNTVKHTFSYDITGIELCYLASGRDIVHLIAEGRSHVENGKCKGSDGFNLIPYPLIKAVGGVVCSLNGIELGETKFDPHKIYDFIGAVNLELVDEFIEKAVKI